MWHPKGSVIPVGILLIGAIMNYHPSVAQFYSLSFGTDESFTVSNQPPPPPPSAPSAPVKQELRQKVTPLDAMIDKTNHLGFRVLHQHSKGNKNNIAFSPCALASILVALYEGSAGRSAAELHDQLVVPYDKDVLRVGYRDVHRRLRSYFYQKENLLNGLSLSSENITIRPEYESVLKFYGYDLESIPEMRMQATTLPPPLPSTTPEMEADSTTSSDATTDDVSNSTEPMETTSLEGTGTVSEEPTTVPAVGGGEENSTEGLEGSGGSTASDATPTEETIVPDMETVTEEAPAESTPGPEEAPEEGGEKRRRNLRKRGKRLLHRQQSGSPHRRRSLRMKRQPEEIDIVSHQRFLQNFLFQDLVATGAPTPLHATETLLPAAGGSERVNPFRQPQTEPEEYRLLDDTIEHNFYLTDTEIVRVPYKVYNTILKYAYIEELKSTVIELELDSEDYKLLLILPDYEYGLGNVLKLLQVGENGVPNLRDITSQMSPTWVKTIVPKFNLKGSIVLTSDLQNLGINDIFEPARADFTLMTEDPTIYAKHIEQSININIRTHSLQQLKRFTSLYKNPVELAVNYPFLFCILDNELDLALMVGRILNPLNSRIH